MMMRHRCVFMMTTRLTCEVCFDDNEAHVCFYDNNEAQVQSVC